MVFSCAPNFRAKAAAKKQALKQKLAGAGAYHGVSLRLLLVDKQVDEQDVLPHAALGCVHVVKYDAHSTTLAELVALIREAHRQNGAPFLSMAIAQHGADSEGQWEWTTDLTVNLKSVHGAIDQLAPIVEVLAAALSKTTAGKAHIDLLACNLATTCKGLVPALEKMYGIDFRASTDETGNDLSGGDWKMETDNDYDVAADYLDAAKLKAYAETMVLKGCCAGRPKGIQDEGKKGPTFKKGPTVAKAKRDGSNENIAVATGFCAGRPKAHNATGAGRPKGVLGNGLGEGSPVKPDHDDNWGPKRMNDGRRHAPKKAQVAAKRERAKVLARVQPADVTAAGVVARAAKKKGGHRNA